MTNLLFVYGSLMPRLTTAFGAAQRSRLAAESTDLGPATLIATLYNLGQYPGLVISNNGNTVHGTLLRLADPARTFTWLDPFEDIEDGQDPALALYERSLHTVDCNEKAQHAKVQALVLAWVYVMRRVPPGALIVASGIWHAPSP